MGRKPQLIYLHEDKFKTDQETQKIYELILCGVIKGSSLTTGRAIWV
jgi:hypothetical protein